MMNGDQTLGPNAVLAFDREAYLNNGFNFKDSMDIINFQGSGKCLQNIGKRGSLNIEGIIRKHILRQKPAK